MFFQEGKKKRGEGKWKNRRFDEQVDQWWSEEWRRAETFRKRKNVFIWKSLPLNWTPRQKEKNRINKKYLATRRFNPPKIYSSNDRHFGKWIHQSNLNFETRIIVIKTMMMIMIVESMVFPIFLLTQNYLFLVLIFGGKFLFFFFQLNLLKK